jgi:NTE family protein
MKRALVLSGGGVKGAFHVGVLEHLIREEGRDWGYMMGVSVGALNVSVLGQAPVGKLYAQYDVLLRLWTEAITGNSSVWTHWFPLRGMSGLWKHSIYDSTPLLRLIEGQVRDDAARQSGRELRFGAVAYGSGMYVEATQNSTNIARWVAASAALPPFFAPQSINNDLWMDGAVRCVAPLKGAIDWGADEIDVILAYPRSSSKAFVADRLQGTKVDALTIAMRAISLQGDELFTRDVKLCEHYNSLVAANYASNKRLVKLNVYEPNRPLLNGAFSTLTFDPKKIREMITLGVTAARQP